MILIGTKIIDGLLFKFKLPFWFIYNQVLFKIQNISYEDFPKISGFILVNNRGLISIGKNCVITSSRKGNPVGNCYDSALYCSSGGRIRIGDNVGMSNTLLYSQQSIIIENFVMIGGGVQIWDTDFHPMNLEDRIIHDVSKITTKPVLLKKGCFIGANSIILKGVTIGENSIVAAGSVVSKSVPENEIWGGNPARLIKTF
jgi:acetyltransferase-like isoleucine patch superfamily enzyme